MIKIFNIFCGKVFRNFSVDNLRTMLKSSVPESSTIFICIFCNYNTSRLSQYNRHLLTSKHQKLEKSTDFNKLSTKINNKISVFECKCGKVYRERTGLWRHKKVCTYEETETEEEEITDKDLIMMLVKQNTQLFEQNSEILEVIKNGTHNTNNSHNNTNSHNKTFNLQFFLNETCKDAMNIMDFVDSIKLQLTDLENVGRLGYVEGISNIITSNLKALDITQRPIHCADKKREVVYVKDENKWEKDHENKKIRKAIKRVVCKNQGLLPKFKEEHPDCGKYNSKYSDQYNKIVVESMGGSGDNDMEKEDKIIRNISKNVTIDKE
jgi:hypothetical protein